MVTIDGITFYNIQETAKLLGVSPRTLYRWTTEEGTNKPEHAALLKVFMAPNGKKIFRQKDILSVVSECLGIEIRAESLKDLPGLAKA